MPAELSLYEVRRLKNIEENKRVLKELGLYKPFQLVPKNIKKRRPKQLSRKRKASSESPVPSKAGSQPGSGLGAEGGSSFTSGVRKSRRLTGLKPPSADEVDTELSKVDPDADYTPTKPVRRENTFGAIEGVEVGREWMMRIDCSRDGIHRPTVAGIHGNEEAGCYSLALSGGYEDDLDLGESFTYTGEGGRDLKGTRSNPKNLRTAPQSRDQTLTRGNLALTRNLEFSRPVRVIRGYKLDSPYAPDDGYRYDGLYMVEKYWFTTGLAGHGVYKFALRRCHDQAPPLWEVEEPDSPSKRSDSAYSSQSERETDDAVSEQDKASESDTSELSPASSPAVCEQSSPSKHDQEEDSLHVEEEDSLHVQEEDSLHVQEEDSLHVQEEDSLHVQGEDSLHVQGEDSLHVQEEDSLHDQEEDSLHVQEEDSLHVQEEDSLHVQEEDSLHDQEEDSLHVQEEDSLHVQEEDSLHVQEEDSLHVQEEDSLHVQEEDSLHVQEEDSLHVQEEDSLHVQEEDSLHVQEEDSLHVQETSKPISSQDL